MIITVITAIVIILFCLYLVLTPFFQKPSEFKEVENSELSKEQLYAVINELEMDYYMNKISKTDYFQSKAEYENLVASLIKKDQKGCFVND